MFEFIFVQQYLWLPSLNSYAFYNTADLEIGKCRATSTAAVLAFLSQFSLLGGEVRIPTCPASSSNFDKPFCYHFLGLVLCNIMGSSIGLHEPLRIIQRESEILHRISILHSDIIIDHINAIWSNKIRHITRRYPHPPSSIAVHPLTEI